MAREYKDSGIEWIGRIPKGWNVSQLKRFVSFQNGQDYKEIEVAEGFPVYGSGGIFAYASQYIYEGESILFGRKGTINRPLYINCKFWTVDTMYYTIPKKNVCAKFLYYAATTLPYDKYSTSTALPSMTQTMLGNLNIVIPPISEQKSIASYLDKKCAEIDSLVELQEQMIAQLTDYKQSVITEAVTKGLNPEAEIVPSGIDWIGDVPKNWMVNKVNRLFGIIGSGTTPNSSDDNAFVGSINWLQSGDINGGIITNACKKISNDTLAKYSVLSVYKAPFIIIAMYGASVGNISISHIDACVNQACCVLSEPKIDFTYAFYAIKSAQRYLIFRAVGGGQPNISQYTLRQLWIPEPPLDEQQAIASYLDTKCHEIDSLIELKRQKIEVLKEYKKSVIFEAVTGKIMIE